MIFKNVASQFIQFGSLTKTSDGSRLTSSATARVCKDGTWGASAGTLSVEETDQYKYAPTQSETNCDILTVVVDHADAVQPLVFTCRTVNQIAKENAEQFFSDNTSDFVLEDVATQVNTAATAAGDAAAYSAANAAALAGTLDANVTHFGGTAGTFTAGRPSVEDVEGDVFGNIGGGMAGNVDGSVSSVGSMVTANVIQISGDTTAANNCETFFEGGYLNVQPLYRLAVTQVSEPFVFRVANPGLSSETDLRGFMLLLAGSSTFISPIMDMTFISGNTVIELTIKEDVGFTTEIGDQVLIYWPSFYRDDQQTISTIVSRTDVATSTRATAAQVNAECDTALADYAALKPTVSGRTLDVNAGGEAGIDWANVGSPGTTVNLSATTVANVDEVESVEEVSSVLADVSVSAQQIRDAMKLAPSAGAAAANSIDDKLDNVGGGGGTAIPVNQIPVPIERTWILKSTTDGLRSELPLIRVVGESQVFAVDWRADLATNGRLTSLDAVAVVSGPTGGVVVSQDEEDQGVDRTQSKFKLTLVAEGTYTIAQMVGYSDADGDGTASGITTLIVRPSALP